MVPVSTSAQKSVVCSGPESFIFWPLSTPEGKLGVGWRITDSKLDSHQKPKNPKGTGPLSKELDQTLRHFM